MNFGELHLLCSETGVITVERADPTKWFSQRELQDMLERPQPSGGWSFDGSLITLHVANGRWIWKLTGRKWTHEYGPGTEPLVMLEAVWPD